MSPMAKKVVMYDFVLTSGAMIPSESGELQPVRIERGDDPVTVSVTRQLGNTLDVARRGYWVKGPPKDHNRVETATDEQEGTSGPSSKKKTTRGPTGT